MYQSDNRIVVTLDAGGTNFVFGAIEGHEFIIEPITLSSLPDNLDECLAQMVKGFELVISQLRYAPAAISFAFPGPADYKNGIIGGYLPNFPSFREGVALGSFLERHFGVPVFINNDGDLFAYGEALAGKLPEINRKVEALGGVRKSKSLIGYTFGTGFGIGHVYDNTLHLGDNCCVETFCLRNKYNQEIIVEEGVAVRAVKRVYAEESGSMEELEPKDIFDIAEGTRSGNQGAAIRAFEALGEVAGSAMATAATLLDGIIVIGGGITAAAQYFMPSLLRELRATIKTLSGDCVALVQPKIYNLDNDDELLQYAKGNVRQIKIYGTEEYVNYDQEKRLGVAISSIGASKAISLGAYNYALSQLDK